MPTATEVKELGTWLAGQEYSIDLMYRPASRVQWYKPDGTPLPNLMPCDAHHIKRFRAKGWTLIPNPQPKTEAVPGERAFKDLTPEEQTEWRRANMLKARLARGTTRPDKRAEVGKEKVVN